MAIDPRVLSKTVKTIAPKKERLHESQVRGTVVYRTGDHYIQLDGAPNDSLTPIANVEEGLNDSGFVHGDRVLVLIKNHQAIVTKNLTTGLQAQSAKVAKETAEEAQAAAGRAIGYAEEAYLASEEAKADAAEAHQAATEAKADAAEAHQAATEAKADAAEAKRQATRATGYANDALTQLSIVEDVSGTLAWIQEHGSYIPTTDTTVQEGTVYFIYNSETGDYEPIVSPDPTKNPQSEGWYILDISDSQSNFIMAHLAVTSRGLWVLPGGLPDQDQTIDPETDAGSPSDTQSQKQANANARQANDYKVLLSNDGMYIYDDAGHLVTIYGESIIFDSSRPQSIGGENAYILFHDTNDDDVPDTITIGGNVVMLGSDRTLSEMLSDIKATAEGTLIYDHTYVLSADKQTATFTAHVYRGGQEVTSEFNDEQFTWYYKVERSDDPIPINNNVTNDPPNSGKTISVSLANMKYGGEVVGWFTTESMARLLRANGDTFTDSDGNRLLARTQSSGEEIRVRDLTYTTTLYPTDGVLVVQAEDERLTTIASLADTIWTKYGVKIEQETLQQGNNNYEDIGLNRITNSELEALIV